MDHFAGLDVSVKETSICIVDDRGRDRAGSEGSERSSAAGSGEPDRIGLEARPLSQ
jgi:transposase